MANKLFNIRKVMIKKRPFLMVENWEIRWMIRVIS